MAIVADLSGNGFGVDRSVTQKDFVTSSRVITPSDTVDLNPYGNGILVDAAGAVSVQYVNGGSDTVNLAEDIWHPMRSIKRVMATGTAATGIHVGY